MKISANSLLRFCCYFSLAICFMPVVDYYCPWYVTMLPALLALILSLRINPKVSNLIVAFGLITSLGILLLWFLKRSDNLALYFINFYISFLPVFISVQINRAVEDENFFRDYLRTVIVLVSITCVTTMIGHGEYPMASRELASGSVVYDTDRYRRSNIGGYDFIYATVLLIPLVLWQCSRESGAWKVFHTVALVIMVLCVYSSQYTIALVCAGITFLVVWMQKNKKAALSALLILVLFFMFSGLTYLSELFRWLSDIIELEYVSDRLLQVSQFLGGQNVDTETSAARILHYTKQWETFCESPLVGMNLFIFHENAVSGHSLILDMMGAGGMVMTAALLALLRSLYKVAVRISKNASSEAVQSVWIVAALLAVLNPVTFTAIVTVAFPCCMCANRLEK